MRAKAAAEVRFPHLVLILSDPIGSHRIPSCQRVGARWWYVNGKAHLGCDLGTHLHFSIIIAGM
ncbi:hypothetical protein KDI_54620 [Dictyobacter arantiisoli]|uniref:Uncharacterized protein n=1 Tax=Dictyobacter arantiisoli TaxID=2014874 RepID=A0A5A5TKX1_9CHLR|nr:hypothetical protein KDI_54620 [Dictyobacter arantiisoli]